MLLLSHEFHRAKANAGGTSRSRGAHLLLPPTLSSPLPLPPPPLPPPAGYALTSTSSGLMEHKSVYFVSHHASTRSTANGPPAVGAHSWYLRTRTTLIRELSWQGCHGGLRAQQATTTPRSTHLVKIPSQSSSTLADAASCTAAGIASPLTSTRTQPGAACVHEGRGHPQGRSQRERAPRWQKSVARPRSTSYNSVPLCVSRSWGSVYIYASGTRCKEVGV